jgi:SAM-dependent methyltransferase
MSDIVERARTLTGYDEVSRIRQAQDLDWVLGLAPEAPPRAFADLGCGTGTLLERALARWPETLERVVGVDGQASRVAEARERLGGRAGADVAIRGGDLLALPDDAAERFDVITLTSVLHWLYPDEGRLLAWVDRHLAAGGAFLLTTHHPHPEGASGRGAEDVVVAEALAALGVAEPPGAVPISERARPAEDVAALLAEHLEVDAIEERYVTMEASSAQEWSAFHASTFGTYFSRLAPAEDEERFFAEVGRAAWRRQREQGSVYPITVRLWRARRRGDGAPR